MMNLQTDTKGVNSMTRTTKNNAPFAVIDFETDPFLYGRVPKVFAAGYFDGAQFVHFWGTHESVIAQLTAFLETVPPRIIYAHNGGKFDFFYLLHHLHGNLMLVNGRILKANMGHHELRDSYAAIPVPLKAYAKDEVDYEWFETENRERYRETIVSYLRGDCVYLYELLARFRERFGDKLTIGSVAMSELRKLYELGKSNEAYDAKFREFFFGGRVQCLEVGTHRGHFEVYDVNSMYPFVMREFHHPNGGGHIEIPNARLSDDGQWIKGREGREFFAIVTGTNRGAFPLRTKESLEWESKRGTYHVTSHELRAALEIGAFDLKRIDRAYVFDRSITFEKYVDKFMADKLRAETEGDKVGRLFAKLLLNSGFGKFALNPRNFAEYRIGGNARDAMADGFTLYEQWDDLIIWHRPQTDGMNFHDVATAASITGAARAMLMRALHAAQRPLYCDTDSIICEALPLDLHASRLGAWKTEASGDTVHIAGRKLYAVMKGDECVKLASKGARLTAADIAQIAGGETVQWRSDAPNFKLNGRTKFVDRKIRRIYD